MKLKKTLEAVAFSLLITFIHLHKKVKLSEKHSKIILKPFYLNQIIQKMLTIKKCSHKGAFLILFFH
jgi:hypothetical protein